MYVRDLKMKDRIKSSKSLTPPKSTHEYIKDSQKEPQIIPVFGRNSKMENIRN